MRRSPSSRRSSRWSKQYRVTIDDGHGGQASRDVTVTLTNPDHVPVVTAWTNGSVARDDMLDPVSPNLVLNPGFEGQLASWSFNGGGGVAGSMTHSGSWVYFANSNQGISQSFATTAGTTYTIDFSVPAYDTGSGPNAATVLWDGATVAKLVNIAGTHDGFGNITYTHYTYTVVATDSSTTLSFAFNPGSSLFWLDNISARRWRMRRAPRHGRVHRRRHHRHPHGLLGGERRGLYRHVQRDAGRPRHGGGHPARCTGPSARPTRRSPWFRRSSRWRRTRSHRRQPRRLDHREVAVTLTNPDHAPVLTSAPSGASVFSNRSFAVPAGNMVQNAVSRTRPAT